MNLVDKEIGQSPALVAYAFQILQIIDPGARLDALKNSGTLSLPSDLAPVSPR
ncbi:hypothetical protein [Streptomyces sp. NPDC047024]|uniref:hypothetical protein n=1 Tax=Streptomyces sp. NPDC047024 TaxID=3155476 RepID=UPI0033F04515